MGKIKLSLIYAAAVLVFYGASLKYGFSQDDYYFLLISQADSIGDIINFFSPWAQEGFPFYRPLGTQVYFYFSVLAAGLERAPILMHALMLAVHTGSAFLAYTLTKKLTRDPALSVWVGVLYGSAAAHFLSLFYIAATQQLLAAFFGLLSLNFFCDKKKWRAAGALLLALLCKENAILVPVVASLLYQFSGLYPPKLRMKKLLSDFLPYIAVGLFYVGFRMAAGISVQSEYTPVIGPSLISTLRWYFMFGYGSPEVLMNYAVPGLFINFWRYIRDFGFVGGISSVSTIILSLFAVYILIKSMSAGKPLTRNQVMLYVLWWIVSIALIVWYPDHRYPHYLDIGLIPLLLIIMQPVKGYVRTAVGVLLLVASYTGITVSIRSHWTVKRAEAAEIMAESIEKNGCRADSLLLAGTGRQPAEMSYALSLANGPRVICGKPDMSVYYGSIPSSASDSVSTVPIVGFEP